VILWDVDLWVYAFRADSPLHGLARAEIDAGFRTGDGYLFCPAVAASFLRLVTNPRVFVKPSSSEEAWAFVDTLESGERAVNADIDLMTWGVFKHVCMALAVTGNGFPDALLAALAIRHSATFVTADRGFERFGGLSCRFLA
jgi:hypothetical protein